MQPKQQATVLNMAHNVSMAPEEIAFSFLCALEARSVIGSA